MFKISLYKGETRINEIYYGETPILSVYNNLVRKATLNKEIYKWLLTSPAYTKHRMYVWDNKATWNDDLFWYEGDPLIFPAFMETGIYIFNIDTTALMSDYTLKTIDRLYK